MPRFYLEGAKTGEKIRMLVDVGAIYVILSPSLAEGLGIEISKEDQNNLGR